MWPQFLRGFANTLVVAYAMDGLVSILDAAVDVPALTVVRNALATLVVLQCAFSVPLLGLTRRLPLSVFVPIVSSALWFGFGALPLPFHFDVHSLERALVFVQGAIAVYAFWRIRRLRRGAGWLFDAAWFAGPLFSPRYFAVYGLAACSTILVSLVVLSLAALTAGLESATRGFVRFDSGGVSLADRVYENFGRRIRLVGMMHIGEEAGYQTLFRDLGQATSSTLVLTEGVSDSEGNLSGGFAYAPLAEFLGVEEQREIQEYLEWDNGQPSPDGPIFMNADLDVSDFDPRTIQWLERVASIYRGGDLFSNMLAFYREMERDAATAAIVSDDIIGHRNEVLIAHIESARSEYAEIVVPWGALHLPGIEAAVVNMGYVRRSTAYVPLISWHRLAAAFLGASASGAEGTLLGAEGRAGGSSSASPDAN